MEGQCNNVHIHTLNPNVITMTLSLNNFLVHFLSIFRPEATNIYRLICTCPLDMSNQSPHMTVTSWECLHIAALDSRISLICTDSMFDILGGPEPMDFSVYNGPYSLFMAIRATGLHIASTHDQNSILALLRKRWVVRGQSLPYERVRRGPGYLVSCHSVCSPAEPPPPPPTISPSCHRC